MSDSVSVSLFDPWQDSRVLPYLVALHAHCIRADNAITTFKLLLPTNPSDTDAMLHWWKQREITSQTRALYVAIKGANTTGRPHGPDVIGFVMLSMSHETDPHRGVVEDLCVKSDWRERGVASRLIEVLEKDAAQQGRTLLTLHAETKSVVAQVYWRFGFVECGNIPEYFTDPAGQRKDGTPMYKQLQSASSG